VLTVNPAPITRLNAFVAVCCGLELSFTVTETLNVPADVALPVIAPVDWLIDKPAGNPVADQV
jgi:hypothetical protein